MLVPLLIEDSTELSNKLEKACLKDQIAFEESPQKFIVPEEGNPFSMFLLIYAMFTNTLSSDRYYCSRHVFQYEVLENS